MEQRFRPVQKAGGQVVTGKLEGNLRGVMNGQFRPGQQVLVHQNGTIGFALVAEVRPDGQVQGHGFLVDRQGLNKVVDRLVGVIGKQKLKPFPDR